MLPLLRLMLLLLRLLMLFQLLMPLFLCRRWEGTPMPRVHSALKWVRPRDLSQYPMPPADLPLIPMLRDLI